jgi:vitamin B12 transporter
MLGTYSGGFNFRNAVGPVYGSVTASGYETNGFNISRFGAERDASRAFIGTGKFGIDSNEYLNLEAVVRYANRSADGDLQDFSGGSPTYGLLLDGNQRTDHEGLAARVGATLKLFDERWIQSLNAKFYDETLSAFTNGAMSSRLGGTRTSFDYKSTSIFDTNFAGGERHTVSLLADHRREDYSASFLAGSKFEKSRLGLAGEYVLDLPTHTTLSGALRHDWNDPFENVMTWRLALSQRLPAANSRIHASIGKGITDPDHTETLGFPGFFILPNPNLMPEASVGWDVGFEQSFWDRRLVTDITYFNTVFTDKIQATFIGGDTLYVNAAGEAKRHGVEVTTTLNPTDYFSIAASYTYTHARNSLDVPELRRPAHSGSIEATLKSNDGRGRATLGATYNSERRDTRFNDFPTPNTIAFLPATTVLWANISYDLSPSSTVFLRAENLLNRRYEEIFSYRAQPFAVFAGLRVKLGAQ